MVVFPPRLSRGSEQRSSARPLRASRPLAFGLVGAYAGGKYCPYPWHRLPVCEWIPIGRWPFRLPSPSRIPILRQISARIAHAQGMAWACEPRHTAPIQNPVPDVRCPFWHLPTKYPQRSRVNGSMGRTGTPCLIRENCFFMSHRV